MSLNSALECVQRELIENMWELKTLSLKFELTPPEDQNLNQQVPAPVGWLLTFVAMIKWNSAHTASSLCTARSGRGSEEHTGMTALISPMALFTLCPFLLFSLIFMFLCQGSPGFLSKHTAFIFICAFGEQLKQRKAHSKPKRVHNPVGSVIHITGEIVLMANKDIELKMQPQLKTRGCLSLHI